MNSFSRTAWSAIELDGAAALEDMPRMKHEDALAGSPAPFRVEHSHISPGCVVEARRYFWSKPLDLIMQAWSDALVINMALTSRPLHTRVDRIMDESDPLVGEAGRLLIMIPGMPYQLAAPSGSFRSLHCAIDCERFEAVVGEAIDWPSLGSFAGETRAGWDIEAHMTRIHGELVQNRIGRDRVIEASLDMICVEMARQFRSGHPARPDVLAGGLAAWRMRLILGRVHADEPAPRIVELAGLCGLTERQLSRAFKAETGSTLGRFIDEVTMERAHRLLSTTALSIAAIARELGFASADSFTQAYRRHTGASPSRSRRL